VHAPPDAPEFQARSALPYEGPGTGQVGLPARTGMQRHAASQAPAARCTCCRLQVESRLPEEAVSYGLGAMERKASERLGHELGKQGSLPHPTVRRGLIQPP
jgi:hypothetical protein